MLDGKIVKTTLPWAWLLLATLNSAVLVLWEKEALWVDSKQAAIGHADKLDNEHFTVIHLKSSSQQSSVLC